MRRREEVLTEPGDFERMRLLPKFRFLRFLSRCLFKEGTRDGESEEEEAEREPESVANSSELGHIQRAWPSCMPEV